MNQGRIRELVMDYLRSKSHVMTLRMMHEEAALIDLEPDREARMNNYHSELEVLLSVPPPDARNAGNAESAAPPVEDCTLQECRFPTRDPPDPHPSNISRSSSRTSAVRPPLLFDMVMVSETDEALLREHRGVGTAQERVRFHLPRLQTRVRSPPPDPSSEAAANPKPAPGPASLLPATLTLSTPPPHTTPHPPHSRPHSRPRLRPRLGSPPAPLAGGGCSSRAHLVADPLRPQQER